MQDNIIITFANQKGGVGKTTLCTLFANYLVTHRKKVLVIDCDVQQTISFRRKADLHKYKDVTIPYNIQPFNIANATNVQNLMTNLRKMQGIILIDAPGNLTQQGLIPIFANSDYIICPFQYEVTSINATATFISFIYKIRAKLSKNVAQLFLVDNSHDKRFGKKEELELWRMTAGSRIVKELNLQRTADEERSLRSKSRKALIRLERAHVTFGLPPITHIKVVSNKHRSRLRVKLKSCGYIVLKRSNTIYYLSDFKRPSNEMRT